MKQYFWLTAVSILFAFAAGYFALSLRTEPQASEQDILEIFGLLDDFQKSQRPLATINFSTLYQGQQQGQLLEPIISFPRDTFGAVENQFSTHENCFAHITPYLTSKNFEKVLLWEEFRCRERSKLPPRFFAIPPFMHPSGKSYAYLAFLLGVPPHNHSNWVQQNIQYFHLTELKEIEQALKARGGLFTILHRLKKESLFAISQKQEIILSKDYLLFHRIPKSSPSPRIYEVYARSKFDSFIKEGPYQVTDFQYGENCYYRFDELCFRLSDREVLSVALKTSWALFILASLALAMTAYHLLHKIHLQRQEDERRRLALHVLTHEFRTPISSLLLTIDGLQAELSHLPAQAQEQVLRISSDVFRLQRLTEKSRHYLRTHSKGSLVQLQAEEMNHLMDYFHDFEGDDVRVELINPENLSLIMDPYWLEIIIKNLIENARFHGKPPINLKVTIDDKHFQIEVQDLGSCHFSQLKEMVKEFKKGSHSLGSGLGLSIVQKVVKEMKGSLTYRSQPTTFTIILPRKII